MPYSITQTVVAALVLFVLVYALIAYLWRGTSTRAPKAPSLVQKSTRPPQRSAVSKQPSTTLVNDKPVKTTSKQKHAAVFDRESPAHWKTAVARWRKSPQGIAEARAVAEARKQARTRSGVTYAAKIQSFLDAGGSAWPSLYYGIIRNIILNGSLGSTSFLNRFGIVHSNPMNFCEIGLGYGGLIEYLCTQPEFNLRDPNSIAPIANYYGIDNFEADTCNSFHFNEEIDQIMNGYEADGITTVTLSDESANPITNPTLQDKFRALSQVLVSKYNRVASNTDVSAHLLHGTSSGSMTWMQSPSTVYANASELAPIHFFFVDGDHSYNGTLADLNSALANSNAHSNFPGIIIIDDYDLYDGVRNAVEDFRTSNGLNLHTAYANGVFDDAMTGQGYRLHYIDVADSYT